MLSKGWCNGNFVLLPINITQLKYSKQSQFEEKKKNWQLKLNVYDCWMFLMLQSWKFYSTKMARLLLQMNSNGIL